MRSSLLEQGEVERLILSRPAVEAGERLGFLPGDMREKVDPYLRPIYDALYDFMEARHVERGLQTGMIEIAPLAFMRGRTLTNAVVLLDEAQNTTPMQMKMFLTRLGEGSRMIVTGDPTPDRPAAGPEIRPGRGGAHPRRASRASAGSPSASRTWCATTSCAASSAPTSARRPRPSRRAKAVTAIELDVAVEAERLGAPLGDVEALARRAVEAALRGRPRTRRARRRRAQPAADRRRGVRALNRDWRGKDKPTNVLSFPAAAPPDCPGARPLGDIVLAYETRRARGGERGQDPRRPLRPPDRPRRPASPRLRPRDRGRGRDHGRRSRSKALAGFGIADPYRGAVGRPDAAEIIRP